ncbi:S-adenosyl-L-methionine-dependent methyltransferase [Mycena latifolia]|nr:S-adenosyl-L-methionine-dependent methyltransferase [Mycena latifolia]
MPTTHAELDNPDLATTYSNTNAPQQKYGLKMIDALDIHAGMTVVDLGCGTGDLALHVAELVGPEGRVIGIEPMADRVAIARERAAAEPRLNVSFFVGSSNTLSKLVKEKVHIVYMCSVLHWIENKAAALSAISSILRPDGKLGITCGSGAKHPLSPKVAALSEEPYAAYPTEGIAKFLSESELKEHLGAAGFATSAITALDDKVEFASKVAMMKWLEASAFGNFWYVDFLPEELRASAKQSIEAKYDALDTGDYAQFELPVTMLVTVAFSN